jgi:hypothetical protein
LRPLQIGVRNLISSSPQLAIVAVYQGANVIDDPLGISYVTGGISRLFDVGLGVGLYAYGSLFDEGSYQRLGAELVQNGNPLVRGIGEPAIKKQRIQRQKATTGRNSGACTDNRAVLDSVPRALDPLFQGNAWLCGRRGRSRGMSLRIIRIHHGVSYLIQYTIVRRGVL